MPADGLPDDVPARIEHTALGPTTTWTDVAATLDAATEYGMRACVPPCYVAEAADYADRPLTTVLDFPQGQGDPAAVAAAARRASEAGADELDLVANVGRLKGGDDAAVRDGIATVVDAVDCPVKVIVEAPLLTDDELDRAGAIAADAGADYLKTATGFADGGATVPDVERLARHLPVKASGGIGSWDAARAMFEAGAERIGASSGDAIVREWLAAVGGDARGESGEE